MSETGEVAPSSTHTLLVLGAPQCGKSSFIQRIVRDKFSSVEPMGSERVEVQHDTMLEVRKTKKESVPVHIIEASGARDAFRANWKRWFVQSGAVLVLYDASVPFSFEFACKLVSTLVLERESGRPRLPFAFVGTRSDVAANSPSTSVAPQVAAAFAERTGACVHGVVSAKGDKRVALLALVRVLLEQLRPDRVNASMRAVTAKCALVCDTLAKVGDNSADEFVAVLHALRATLARRVDADKLIRDEASFDMLCSALGKQEALLDVYLSKLDKSAKSAKLQRFVSNNKLRRKLEKLSSQLESVRVVIESTIANVRLDEQPEGTIVVGQYAPSAMIASSDQAPPPLATPPDLPQRIDRPPARPAPEPSAAVVADRHAADRHGGVSSPLISSRSAIKSSLERAPSSAAAALASATTSTMARLVQRGVDVGAVIDDDDDARAFWQRSFGDAYQVPFETFVHEFGTVAFAEGSSAEIKPADARVLRGVLDDAETDFVNVYKFAHFARGLCAAARLPRARCAARHAPLVRRLPDERRRHAPARRAAARHVSGALQQVAPWQLRYRLRRPERHRARRARAPPQCARRRRRDEQVDVRVDR
jgi:GTPase SAR1 family protein